MTQNRQLIPFDAPWRFGATLSAYALQPDGRVVADRSIALDKALRKATRGVSGLLLRPIWPGRRGLVVLRRGGEGATLHALRGGRLDLAAGAVDITDPTFRMSVAERGLYRRFVFSTDTQSITLRDMAGRLVAPQRASFQLFATNDFSSLARLVGMLETRAQRERFLSDLARGRFKYARWLDSAQARWARQGLRLQS